jgi:hypothetical protein
MTYVRKADGGKIVCNWDDCEKFGHEEFKAVVREPAKNLHYIFCGEGHKALWVNSQRDNGNAASGSKSALFIPPKTSNRAMRRSVGDRSIGSFQQRPLSSWTPTRTHTVSHGTKNVDGTDHDCTTH